MIAIETASAKDFPVIQSIAYNTWPETYGQILSKAQLDYMLDRFYSLDNLALNLKNDHQFYVIYEDEMPLGFIGIEHNHNDEFVTKIHKIYMLPSYQGKGIGKLTIDFIIGIALKNQSQKLRLNVNKFNKAMIFYQKLGFEIVEVIDIEIGNGYLMEDFVMEKTL